MRGWHLGGSGWYARGTGTREEEEEGVQQRETSSWRSVVVRMSVEAIFIVICVPAVVVAYLFTYAYKFSQVAATLKEEEEQRGRLRQRQNHDNNDDKTCSRCRATFHLLLRKRLCCAACRSFVCKDCAGWSARDKGWLCNACDTNRVSVVPTTNESHRHHVISTKSSPDSESELESDSGYNPSSVGSRTSSVRTHRPMRGLFASLANRSRINNNNNADQQQQQQHLANYVSSGLAQLSDGSASVPLDPQVLQIREHIETLVEKLIGGDLDDAQLHRICTHTEFWPVVFYCQQRLVVLLREFQLLFSQTSSFSLCPVHGGWLHDGGAYDRMFHSYHARLSEALKNLVYALHMAITNQPLSPDETPTCTHAALRQVVAEVLQEAMGLPPLDINSEAGSSLSSSSLPSPSPTLSTEDEVDEILHSQTYEDILAAAILNKVIEQYQQINHRKKRKLDDSLAEDKIYRQPPPVVVQSKEVQTEEDETEPEEVQSPVVDKGVQSDMNQDASGESDVGSESAGEDFSWAEGHNTGPVEYTIEEKIEEITTTVEDTDSDSERPRPRPSPLPRRSVHEPIITKTLVTQQETAMPDLDYLYTGLDFAKSHKVPFPEFGMDIVEGGADNEGAAADYGDEERDVFSVVSPVDEWGDNWRFRKKKQITAYGNMRGRMAVCDEPVPMLIPYPSEESNMRTRIGSRDVDELSELSEHNSIGASDLSSDDEEEEDSQSVASGELHHLTGEIVSEFAQKDREYTEEDYGNNGRYAALSPRVPTPMNDLNKSDEGEQHQRPVPLPRKSKSSTPPSSAAEEAVNVDVRTKPRASPRFSRKKVDDNFLQAPKFVPVAARHPPMRELRFASHPESIVVHSGRAARFRCHIQAEQKFAVSWFFGLELLGDGGRYQISHVGNEALLEIYDTDEGDQGTYSCVLYNQNGHTWVDFRLNIRGSSRAQSVPEFVMPLEDVSVSVGESATLSCRLAGYPEPMIEWFRDGDKVHRSANNIIESPGPGLWCLTISHTSVDDQAEYSAVATNRHGNAASSASLIVAPAGNRHLQQLTKKVNCTQDGVHEEAEKLLQSANQRSASSALRKATGKALDVVAKADRIMNHADRNGEVSLPPAMPGSIAEREHRKWQNPTASIPNNPYSAENLAKRASRPAKFSPYDRHYIASPDGQTEDDLVGPHDLIIVNSPTKIDCGLKSIDSSRYRRDYYVNENGIRVPRTEKYSSSVQVRAQPQPKHQIPLNNVEEKVYLTASKMTHLEDKIRELEAQVDNVREDTPTRKVVELEDKVAHAAAQVTQNERQVSVVESQVARLQQEIDSQEKLHQQQRGVQRRHSDRQYQNKSSPLRLSLNTGGESATMPRKQPQSTISPVNSPSWSTVNDTTSLDRRSSGLGSRKMSASVDHLNMLSPTFPSSNGSLFSSSSMLSLNQSPSPDGERVLVNSRNVRDEVASLPSVRELASRFQSAGSQDSSRSTTLERRKNVVTVVNIFPQSSTSKSLKMEAKNVVTVDKGPAPSHSGHSEVNATDLNPPEAAGCGDALIVNDERDYPSVRELSRRFSVVDDTSSCDGSKPEPERATIAASTSVKRVHSLTARSMSREFREAARRNTPRQMNRNLSISLDGDSESSSPSGLPSPDGPPQTHSSSLSTVVVVKSPARKGSASVVTRTPSVRVNGNGAPCRSPDTDGHGYTSDESNTSTNSLPRHAVSKSLLSRAAFWDRRVEEGLTSDNSVSEDFTSLGFAPH